MFAIIRDLLNYYLKMKSSKRKNKIDILKPIYNELTELIDHTLILTKRVNVYTGAAVGDLFLYMELIEEVYNKNLAIFPQKINKHFKQLNWHSYKFEVASVNAHSSNWNPPIKRQEGFQLEIQKQIRIANDSLSKIGFYCISGVNRQ